MRTSILGFFQRLSNIYHTAGLKIDMKYNLMYIFLPIGVTLGLFKYSRPQNFRYVLELFPFARYGRPQRTRNKGLQQPIFKLIFGDEAPVRFW